MPQTTAAAKALRAGARRRSENDKWREKVKKALHAVRDAVAANDKKAAQEALTAATSILDRAARRNVIHPNKAARKKSRLSKRIGQIK